MAAGSSMSIIFMRCSWNRCEPREAITACPKPRVSAPRWYRRRFGTTAIPTAGCGGRAHPLGHDTLVVVA